MPLSADARCGPSLRCRSAYVVAIIRVLIAIALPARILARPRPNCQTERCAVDAGETIETMATCPECDAEIEVDEFDVDKGDQLRCPECGSNLEVTGLSPLELDIAPDDEEEDDDDDVEEEVLAD